MLKTKKPARPVVSREAYTLNQIEKVFPGGEWVDEQDSAPGGSMPVLPKRGVEVGEVAVPVTSPNLTIIGGSNDALRHLLQERAPEKVIVGTTMTGRGGEREAAELARELGIEVETRVPDVDLFGGKAASVNVELVLSTEIDSPLVLVGNGQRVKEAKSWLKRAQWPREVIQL